MIHIFKPDSGTTTLIVAITVMLRLGLGQVLPAQIAISLALLLFGVGLSLWAGAAFFRLGILMYGRRPGLPELAYAFREA